MPRWRRRRQAIAPSNPHTASAAMASTTTEVFPVSDRDATGVAGCELGGEVGGAAVRRADAGRS